MLSQIKNYWNRFVNVLKYANQSTLNNIIYVTISFIASLAWFVAVNNGKMNLATEFLSNLLSEINFLYALFNAGTQLEDYVGILVVPILYAFISRIIYYFLKNNSMTDRILQIIGNCFLQAFLYICLYGAPENNGIKLLAVSTWSLIGFMVLWIIIAFLKTTPPNEFILSSCIRLLKTEFKAFIRIFRIPIFKRGFAVIFAFLVQGVVLVLVALLLDFLHLAIFIFPLSFIMTPLFLNKLSDIIMNLFYINKAEEEILRDDIICFAFAIIVLVILYMPFWSKFKLFD